MTKLLQKALREVQRLPKAERDLAAKALLNHLAHRGKNHPKPIGPLNSKMAEHVRKKQLGDWGEAKAKALLERAGFVEVRDVNQETHNHPFGDLFGVRGDKSFLIGVKTRNRLQVSGKLNPSFNITKRGRDLTPLATKYGATLAWVAIQVDPEDQRYSAYFGTIEQIVEAKERFSIPMKENEVLIYECLDLNELDRSIRSEWTNRSKP